MQKIYNNMEVIKFLGNCANNLDILNTKDMILNLNDFDERFHKIVFVTLTQLAKEKDLYEVDGTAVAMHLNAFPEQNAIFVANKGAEWIDNAKEMAKNTSVDYSMRTIRKYSLLRRYSSMGMDISEIFNPASTDLEEIELQRTRLDTMDIADIKGHFKLKIIAIEEEFKHREDNVDSYQVGEGILELIEQCKIAPKWGLPFQSKLLNTVLRGMQGSKLVVNSAGTGTGKSRIMAGQMCNISAIEKYCPISKKWIKNNNPVPSLFISTELIREEIQTLFLATISGVPEEDIKNGKFDKETEERLIRAGQVMAQSSMHIEFTSDFSCGSLENMIEQHIIKNGVGYIFFDYIQITPALAQELTKLFGYSPREDVMLSLLTAGLKNNICNKYGVFMWTSTQLNRSYKTDEKPDATHIRGSMAVADKVDVGMITLKVGKAELEKVQKAIDTGFCNKVPTHCIHIYKNRGGTWTGIVIWVHMNLDNMQIQDCFVTTQDYDVIAEIVGTDLG